jgi:hypothetical protein
MTDQPEIIARAQERALSLLSEHHEPLSMAPGDVRTLLARYQRGLSELAEAVGPPASLPHHRTISASDATSLWELRAHWQDIYFIALNDGTWRASPCADRTKILTADTAMGLKVMMQEDYAEYRSRRERAGAEHAGEPRPWPS